MSTGRESPVRQPATRRETRRFITSWRNGCLPLEESRLVSCRRPEAHGVHAAESTGIAASRLEWPPRVARARRDGRGGSCASGRPRDVGPRCERRRALERERDAAFEPLFLYDDASPHADQVPARSIVWGGRLVRIGRPIGTRICLSRVLTPPGGGTRRRISSTGGVTIVVSRDAILRS